MDNGQFTINNVCNEQWTRPKTNNQQLSTNNQQPTTNNQQQLSMCDYNNFILMRKDV